MKINELNQTTINEGVLDSVKSAVKKVTGSDVKRQSELLFNTFRRAFYDAVSAGQVVSSVPQYQPQQSTADQSQDATAGLKLTRKEKEMAAADKADRHAAYTPGQISKGISPEQARRQELVNKASDQNQLDGLTPEEQARAEAAKQRRIAQYKRGQVSGGTATPGSVRGQNAVQSDRIEPSMNESEDFEFSYNKLFEAMPTNVMTAGQFAKQYVDQLAGGEQNVPQKFQQSLNTLYQQMTKDFDKSGTLNPKLSQQMIVLLAKANVLNSTNSTQSQATVSTSQQSQAQQQAQPEADIQSKAAQAVVSITTFAQKLIASEPALYDTFVRELNNKLNKIKNQYDSNKK